jgi:hypothetical protein
MAELSRSEALVVHITMEGLQTLADALADALTRNCTDGQLVCLVCGNQCCYRLDFDGGRFEYQCHTHNCLTGHICLPVRHAAAADAARNPHGTE